MGETPKFIDRMKRGIERRNLLSLRKQIFLALVIITMVSTMIPAFVLFEISRSTVEKEYQTANRDSLQVARNILELSMNSIVDEERNLLTNEAFLSEFTKGQEGTRYFSAAASRQITQQLDRILFSNSEIREILCVNNAGNLIFTTQNDYNQHYMVPYYTGAQDILSGDWIALADKAKGKEVFLGTNVLFDDGKDETFSIAKRLYSTRTRKPIGYVVFNVRKSALDVAFPMKSGESQNVTHYFVLDGDGGVLYTAGQDTLTDTQKEEISSIFQGSDDEDGNYLTTAVTDESTGWKIAAVISKQALSGKSASVGYVAAILAVGIIMISVWLSSIIAGRITRPLNTLEKTMRQVAEGSSHVEEQFDESEVGRIGNQFKDLVNNNIDLKNRLLNSQIREREQQLLLLQTQINPHYLYNTLDTLYFMAEIRGEEEIADFVQALSENFRLSLNGGDKLIPVSRELERIRAYMKIQNYRFEGRFQLVIDVPEAMMGEYLLTFLLQPLVENSVYHGLEPKTGPGTISLTGSREGGILTFVVEDDGIGIQDPAVLNGGYGIRNIRERIRLFYGEEYGIEFSEGTKGGTRAEIRIPVLSQEEVSAILHPSEEKEMPERKEKKSGGEDVPTGHCR
jgi:two-component system sensor histidine kinase YesM